MSVRVGPYEFEDARYFAWRDSMILQTGQTGGAVDEDIPEDHYWYTDDDGNVVGLELNDVGQKIERDGGFFITLPSGERVREPEVERFVAEAVAS